MSYNITARRPGAKKFTCIKGIKADDRAEQLVKALLHEGFRVTIEEEKDKSFFGVGVVSSMAEEIREGIKEQLKHMELAADGLTDDTDAMKALQAFYEGKHSDGEKAESEPCPKCEGSGALKVLHNGPGPYTYQNCPTCDGHGILAKPMEPPTRCAVD
jgi:DnaJ-class molecular chaperone